MGGSTVTTTERPAPAAAAAAATAAVAVASVAAYAGRTAAETIADFSSAIGPVETQRQRARGETSEGRATGDVFCKSFVGQFYGRDRQTAEQPNK
jgi:hypothetical protein